MIFFFWPKNKQNINLASLKQVCHQTLSQGFHSLIEETEPRGGCREGGGISSTEQKEKISRKVPAAWRKQE